MADDLGRYYTEDRFSNLLVSNFNANTPSTILELGIGYGSLVRAAYKRWQDANFVAVDLDHNRIHSLKRQFPNIYVSKVDGLSPNIENKLHVVAGDVDIAVCNPPYMPLKKSKSYLHILKSSGFENSSKLHKLTTDILFLAQNIKMLKIGGQLGIILPDTLISGSEFELFRKDILLNTTVTGVIQLPMNAFTNTEARTHILFLKKGKTDHYKVPLKIADLKGNIVSEITVNSSHLLKRMDYMYHSFTKKFANKKGLTLKDIDAKIFRGKYSKKELIIKLGDGNFFHTTSFVIDYKEGMNFKKRRTIAVATQKGDLLIARVGKGSIGKLTFVKSGTSEVSDCIMIIRVVKKYQNHIYRLLQSEYGQSWILAHSHGVCSRFITKNDVFDFVIK